jgi:hypothetical protein
MNVQRFTCQLPASYMLVAYGLRASFLRVTSELLVNYVPVIWELCAVYGFGGLKVTCWPLVPKFAGSHPAEAFEFLGRKKSSAHLHSEGK